MMTFNQLAWKQSQLQLLLVSPSSARRPTPDPSRNYCCDFNKRFFFFSTPSIQIRTPADHCNLVSGCNSKPITAAAKSKNFDVDDLPYTREDGEHLFKEALFLSLITVIVTVVTANHQRRLQVPTNSISTPLSSPLSSSSCRSTNCLRLVGRLPRRCYCCCHYYEHEQVPLSVQVVSSGVALASVMLLIYAPRRWCPVNLLTRVASRCKDEFSKKVQSVKENILDRIFRNADRSTLNQWIPTLKDRRTSVRQNFGCSLPCSPFFQLLKYMHQMRMEEEKKLCEQISIEEAEKSDDVTLTNHRHSNGDSE